MGIYNLKRAGEIAHICMKYLGKIHKYSGCLRGLGVQDEKETHFSLILITTGLHDF